MKKIITKIINFFKRIFSRKKDKCVVEELQEIVIFDDFLIIGRDKTNSHFLIKNMKNNQIFDKSEKDIINMIKKGHNFFTLNSDDNTNTLVIVKSGHIKSRKNNTKSDNISNLPIVF
jgi:hypothetical protein